MQLKTEQKRMSLSFAASVAAHAALVLLIAFAHVDKPLPKKQKPQIMDLVMLDPQTTPKEKPPKDAETAANVNAAGGSSEAKDKTTRMARAPMASSKPQPRKPKPPQPQMPKTPPPASPEQRVRTLARRGMELENEPKTNRKPVEKPAQKETLPQIPLSNLLPSSTALAQLSSDFQREKRMKQMLNREADIPINTRQEKYAPYAHALVQALEEQWRPGQADYGKYPDDQRKAMIRLTIEHDGSLGNVEIMRPSPLAQINESAIRAIHDAAPFKPLPSSWGLDRVSFYLTFEVVEDHFVFRAL